MSRRPSLPHKPHSPHDGQRTVLLADDDEAARALARTVLAIGGYAVVDAASGDEAVRLAEYHCGPLDLLVTDVIMPGLDGSETAERVRQRHPAVRVLFVSGYTGDVSVGERAAFLPKPFRPAELLGRAKALLDGTADVSDPNPPPGGDHQPDPSTSTSSELILMSPSASIGTGAVLDRVRHSG